MLIFPIYFFLKSVLHCIRQEGWGLASGQVVPGTELLCWALSLYKRNKMRSGIRPRERVWREAELQQTNRRKANDV